MNNEKQNFWGIDSNKVGVCLLINPPKKGENRTPVDEIARKVLEKLAEKGIPGTISSKTFATLMLETTREGLELIPQLEEVSILKNQRVYGIGEYKPRPIKIKPKG